MSKFVVVELQKFEDGTMSHLATAYDTQDAAESAYHSVLAAAAISALPSHAAILVSEEGFPLAHQCYKH